MKIFVNSQIRGYQKFMADKNAHSWCGNGSKSPIPIARHTVKSEIIEKAGGGATADVASGVSHVNCREGRSPP